MTDPSDSNLGVNSYFAEYMHCRQGQLRFLFRKAAHHDAEVPCFQDFVGIIIVYFVSKYQVKIDLIVKVMIFPIDETS